MHLCNISIRWTNPYTTPPIGMPRMLLSTTIDAATIKATELPEVQALLANEAKPGSGYNLCITPVEKAPNPNRKWSKERKAKRRQDNLRKRLARKMKIRDGQQALWGDPLAEAMQRAIQKRPDYFAGGDAHIEQAKKFTAARKKAQEAYRNKVRANQ